jgi:hypothetical protein
MSAAQTIKSSEKTPTQRHRFSGRPPANMPRPAMKRSGDPQRMLSGID